MQTFPQLLICKEIMLLIRLQNLLEAILNTFRYMFIVRALCHVLDFWAMLSASETLPCLKYELWWTWELSRHHHKNVEHVNRILTTCSWVPNPGLTGAVPWMGTWRPISLGALLYGQRWSPESRAISHNTQRISESPTGVGDRGRTGAPQERKHWGGVSGRIADLSLPQGCLVRWEFCATAHAGPDPPSVLHLRSCPKAHTHLPSSLCQVWRKPTLISSKVSKSDLKCHLSPGTPIFMGL